MNGGAAASDGVEFREVTVDQILDLRHDLLCGDRPREAAEFHDDRLPTAHHFAAFVGEAIVACVSFLATEWDGHPAWQVRALLIRPEFRRRGVARSLLGFAEGTVRRLSPIRWLWCNCLPDALGFYERLGWQIAPEERLLEQNGSCFKVMEG